MNNEGPKQAPIQSVVRAISILRCFSAARELGLSEISGMLGLHKSTTAGIVNTLRNEGILEKNPETGKLFLGAEILSLAANAKQGLREMSRPYIQKLLEQTGETVNVGVRDKLDIIYVEKMESTHSMRICTSVGQRRPLYCTAIGKAILAFMDRTEALDLIGRMEFRKNTDRTITDKTVLLSQLDCIRAEGVAYDCEEMEYGLICIAAPIFSRHGTATGAVSVSGPSVRMQPEVLERICGKLKETAHDISLKIAASSTL
jgi:IclR family KDG regulon transcriptional repressor